MPAMKRKFQRSVLCRAIRCVAVSNAHYFIHLLTAAAELLFELPKQINEPKIFRRLQRIVVSQQRERHADDREEWSTSGIVYGFKIAGELFGVEKCCHRHGFFSELIDHHCHPGAAVWMTTARKLPPLRFRAMHQVGPIRER